ncbi:MAG TPA: beta-propeller fold lactonase family protein [Solirubrobacteraceae bacterium]
MHHRLLAAPLALGAALLFAGGAQARAPQAVYTQTNSAAGNAVQVLARGDDGRLVPAGSFPTGGNGTSAGLGSQGAVALSGNRRVLLAVDAGSNDVASFRIERGGLRLVGRVPSRGDFPVSVTVHGRNAYVLNAGAVANVAAFRLSRNGVLTPRFAGRAPLSTPTAGAAQVAVAPDGRALVVTEKAASRLETFPLRRGLPGDPVVTPSSGPTPFGFAFDPRGTAIVSEASNSTASSYRLAPGGGLRVISASVQTLQGAACWVAVTPDGRFAYTGNAATGSITGFAIAPDGSLTRLAEDGRSASSPRPNDLAIAGGYLYAVNPIAGSVTIYRINADGSLAGLGAATGLPTGLAGLAAS